MPAFCTEHVCVGIHANAACDFRVVEWANVAWRIARSIPEQFVNIAGIGAGGVVGQGLYIDGTQAKAADRNTLERVALVVVVAIDHQPIFNTLLRFEIEERIPPAPLAGPHVGHVIVGRDKR